jgi:acetyltransferase
VPDQVDLAVIVTPARTVPGIIAECAGGRRQGGDHHLGRLQGDRAPRAWRWSGRSSKHRPRQHAHHRPQLPGRDEPHHRPERHLRQAWPAPARRLHQPERRALHGHPRLELPRNVGFSAFVSIGSMLDVGWGDLIDYLGDDPNTKSIVLYMESIGDARAFLSAAREVALTKPIIVIKAGRTERRPRPPPPTPAR